MRHHPAVIALLLGGLIAAAVPVHASVSGRRNTAIGATALSLYQLAHGKTGTGLLAGAGAYYAWSQYNKAHKQQTRRHAYLSGYQDGVRRSYRTLSTSRRYRRHSRR